MRSLDQKYPELILMQSYTCKGGDISLKVESEMANMIRDEVRILDKASHHHGQQSNHPDSWLVGRDKRILMYIWHYREHQVLVQCWVPRAPELDIYNYRRRRYTEDPKRGA